jgi:hypothetical protein
LPAAHTAHASAAHATHVRAIEAAHTAHVRATHSPHVRAVEATHTAHVCATETTHMRATHAAHVRATEATHVATTHAAHVATTHMASASASVTATAVAATVRVNTCGSEEHQRYHQDRIDVFSCHGPLRIHAAKRRIGFMWFLTTGEADQPVTWRCLFLRFRPADSIKIAERDDRSA